MKLPTKEGEQESSFADDLSLLQGFGKKNKETLGELLFGFFRFYGHEFDYDKLVVSVRSGKQITKAEKKWQFGNNNHLCVEEPFNTIRNLGNTADETSFRGLHMELRRAFDLISTGKLEECCEQYEFPPEEKPQAFRKPQAAKPAILRSASQSQSNRGGGRGGGRGGKHSNRNGASHRRASAGTFDNQNQPGYIPGAASLSAQTVWQQQQAQAQLHNDLYQTFNFLQTQEQSLRLQLYSQSQAYMAQAQAQVQNQNSLYGHSSHARVPGSNTVQQQQHAPDRNRTNSFDQAPLSAPIVRPDMYYYPLSYHMVNNYQTPSTNPSSPSISSVPTDLRRSVHRTSITNGSGGPSNSSMRSQSQPAARPLPLSTQGSGVINHPGLGLYSRQQPHGLHFQMADDNSDTGFETASSNNSPPEDITPRKYVGYYVNDVAQNASQREPAALAIPTFGDIQRGHGRRRLSTDQLPPSILDRMDRMKPRPSRSPSPLGNDGTFPPERHSAPITIASTQQGISSTNIRSLNNQMPAVVNGSNIPTPISIPHWQADVTEASVDLNVDTERSHSFGTTNVLYAGNDISGQVTPRDLRSEKYLEPPMVVNGSTTSPVEPFPVLESPAVANVIANNQFSGLNGLAPSEIINSTLRLSPNSRNQFARQNGGMSPLDIGSNFYDGRDDLPHLSPVYETASPSPTANRRFEPVIDRETIPPTSDLRNEKIDFFKSGSKLTPTNGNQVKHVTTEPKTNGHVRGSKSEGGAAGSWQKITKNKKKGESSEKPPKFESERKGG